MLLIRQAYLNFAGGHMNPRNTTPVDGGPSWVNSDRYQISAKAEGTPGMEMMRGPMLQALLEDRFKLKIRREIREVPVYALTVTKSGPKLNPFTEGSCTPLPVTFPVPAPEPGQRFCKAMVALRPPAVNVEGTLAAFSKLLNLVLDRPVIDRTGITGKFDIHLEFTPDSSTPRLAAPSDEAAAAPFIFTAIQEQLGLKLVPAKGPGEFLVIDHVERPSGN